METNKKLKEDNTNLFITYSEEINNAYERAVREALRRHKKAGNFVVTSRDGEVITLQPDEIDVDTD